MTLPERIHPRFVAWLAAQPESVKAAIAQEWTALAEHAEKHRHADHARATALIAYCTANYGYGEGVL